MPTDNGLRYIDSDGHILEHPTGMPAYAPKKYRDRIWHIETDAEGNEALMEATLFSKSLRGKLNNITISITRKLRRGFSPVRNEPSSP